MPSMWLSLDHCKISNSWIQQTLSRLESNSFFHCILYYQNQEFFVPQKITVHMSFYIHSDQVHEDSKHKHFGPDVSKHHKSRHTQLTRITLTADHLLLVIKRPPIYRIKISRHYLRECHTHAQYPSNVFSVAGLCMYWHTDLALNINVIMKMPWNSFKQKPLRLSKTQLIGSVFPFL